MFKKKYCIYSDNFFFVTESVFATLKATFDTYVNTVNTLENISKHVEFKRNTIDLYGRTPSKRGFTKKLLKRNVPCKTVNFRDRNTTSIFPVLHALPERQSNNQNGGSSSGSTTMQVEEICASQLNSSAAVSYSMFQRANNTAKIIGSVGSATKKPYNSKIFSDDDTDNSDDNSEEKVPKTILKKVGARKQIVDSDEEE
jgi:hypothetical protein